MLALLRREEPAAPERRYKVSEATIHQGRDAFLAAGTAAMAQDVWRSKWGKRLFWLTLVLELAAVGLQFERQATSSATCPLPRGSGAGSTMVIQILGRGNQRRLEASR